MPHQRRVIRAAIRQAIIDAATAAGARVYATRVLPLRKLELPAIAVYILEEPVAADSKNTAPRELTREPSVVVECWVSDTAGVNLDDAMDDLAEEVEAAMHADPYFGGAAAESILDDTVIEVVETGDRLMGMVALTYQVTYYTFAPEPPADAGLDNFQTVEATHNLGNVVDPGDVAVDDFIVEAP